MDASRLAVARQFLLAQDRLSKPPTKEEHSRVIQWVGLLLDCEREHGVGTIEDQYLWFQMFIEAVSSCSYGASYSFASWALYRWSQTTENKFGTAYSLGHKDGHTLGSFFTTKRAKERKSKSTMRAVANAATGRCLIGESSKEKIKKEASFLAGKMSKEAAAYKIAPRVGLSPGRVRQLLSKLFPGRSWHTSNDT